jgi:excisionase family DNA binding protein
VNPRLLMTVAEAADYLNLTPKALRRRVERGAVPVTRLGPRTIRFHQFTLDVWMRESQRYAERRAS